MRRRKAAAVERELRAIKRAAAKIETSFEGVLQVVRGVITSKPPSGAARKTRTAAK